MSNNMSIVTSKKFAALKGTALSLVGDLRSYQTRFVKVSEELANLSCPLTQGKDETHIAYLLRCSAWLSEQEFDTAKAEDLKRVEAIGNGQRAIDPQPTTWLGRKLAQAGALVG